MSKSMQRLISLVTKVVVALLVIGPVGALAQVKLENTIQKVERYLDAAGEVQRRLVDAESVVPGDELQYVVRFVNHGNQIVDAGTIVITDIVPEHTQYMQGTAFGPGTDIKFSLDGESFDVASELVANGAEEPANPGDYQAIQWAFSPELKPGEAGYVSFNVRLR